jgi:hypothetical protein
MGHILRVENRVFRRLFGTKRGGVTGEWGKLHWEGLHHLYSSTKYYQDHQIKENKTGGSCTGHAGY